MKVITFGRGPVNDVVISDPKVSSNFHMKIVLADDGSIRVVDGGSLNGTYVNGRKIPGEMAISRGDLIRIGDTMVPWENYINVPPRSGDRTMPVTEETNPLALAGFICSFFVPVVGVVLSAIGLSKANKSVSKKGRGFAIAGLSISIVWLVIQVILIVVGVGVAGVAASTLI